MNLSYCHLKLRTIIIRCNKCATVIGFFQHLSNEVDENCILNAKYCFLFWTPCLAVNDILPELNICKMEGKSSTQRERFFYFTCQLRMSRRFWFCIFNHLFIANFPWKAAEEAIIKWLRYGCETVWEALVCGWPKIAYIGKQNGETWF